MSTELDPYTHEVWRQIRDYLGYEVSSFGRCRSFWGAGGGSKGRRGIIDTPKIIGGYVQGSGHIHVAVYRPGDLKATRFSVHSLVLEAFVGPRPPGMFACHNDSNPANNRLGNLRWDTRKSNAIDALNEGVYHQLTLKIDDIPLIWDRLLAGHALARIGREFGVSGGAISRIRSGEGWSHITQHLPGYPLVEPDERPGIWPSRDLIESTEELWELVPGFPQHRVSTCGRVESRWETTRANGQKTLSKKCLTEDGWYSRDLSRDLDGYPCLVLRSAAGKKRWTIHSLVLTAFVCPKPPGMHACHGDGNRENNHISNLRWDTPRANVMDRVKHAAES